MTNPPGQPPVPGDPWPQAGPVMSGPGPGMPIPGMSGPGSPAPMPPNGSPGAQPSSQQPAPQPNEPGVPATSTLEPAAENSTSTPTSNPSDRQEPPARRRRWKLKLSAYLVLILSLLVAGAALGQYLWPRQQVIQQVVTPTPEPTLADANTSAMPNIVGMSENDARAASADAGYRGEVTVTTRPQAGSVGTVVAQQPASGTALSNATKVSIVTSTEVKMPAVVGKNQAAAVTDVEKLGGAAHLESVVDASRPAGTVLATEPAAGKPMPQIVILKIASGGVARPLTEVQSLESSQCSNNKDVMINGKNFNNAIGCSPYSVESAATISYATSRKANYLKFTLGMPDRAADSAATAKVTVLVDGKAVLAAPVKYGSAKDYLVPITGALRIQIVVTPTTKDKRTEVSFGDISLIGLPAELEQLP